MTMSPAVGSHGEGIEVIISSTPPVVEDTTLTVPGIVRMDANPFNESPARNFTQVVKPHTARFKAWDASASYYQWTYLFNPEWPITVLSPLQVGDQILVNATLVLTGTQPITGTDLNRFSLKGLAKSTILSSSRSLQNQQGPIFMYFYRELIYGVLDAAIMQLPIDIIFSGVDYSSTYGFTCAVSLQFFSYRKTARVYLSATPEGVGGLSLPDPTGFELVDKSDLEEEKTS